jgi:hypothetical protein
MSVTAACARAPANTAPSSPKPPIIEPKFPIFAGKSLPKAANCCLAVSIIGSLRTA